jgi:hypothetical protein
MNDDREIARNLALGRVLLGAVMVLLPRFFGRRWVGAAADSAGTRVVIRGFGARDIALGMATLDALDEDRPVNQLIQLGVLCDAVDAGAVLVAGRGVPLTKRLFTLVVAGAATAIGIRLASTLD